MGTLRRPNVWGGARVPLIGLRRGLFFALVGGTTLVGLGLMLDIVRDSGITALEIAILGLFTTTFAWISVAFWNGAIGCTLILLRRDPVWLAKYESSTTPTTPIASRVAVVMPVHCEDPVRVTSGLAAMVRSLTRTGEGDWFDVHLLSDTTDDVIARQEEAAWTTLRQVLGDRPVGLHYRRRPANVGRKAGNIADFCRHAGDQYDFMVVLDADSIMSGSALVQLVRAMESNPRAGLIQTVPIPVRQSTLFGRLLQFAACVYSPVLATGQSFWQTDAANYWGHNAIIRSAALPAYCDLPVLTGRPPLGGAILSHDFVEAALVRRAGWHVLLLPTIGGSYEEVPGNLPDFARRDRRWSQGSLQHMRLVTTHGLHPLSRLHFVLGAMSYVSSVLWLLMLLASTAYVLLPSLSADPLIGGLEIRRGDAREILPLLGMTAVLLFMPKLLGLMLALVRDRTRYGGAIQLLASALLETAFAVLIAPLMMLIHTRCVGSVLLGRDVPWHPQRRGGRSVAWSEAWRETAGVVITGVVWAAVTLFASPAFFLWLAPIFAGLLLATPIVRLSSDRTLGLAFRRAGLFLVPSEIAPPPELRVAALELGETVVPPIERPLDVGYTTAAP